MSNVKDLYKAHYDTSCELLGRRDTKYEWAASDIFNLTTYDGGLDEIFVKEILEVCRVILDKTNFEYILDRNNYIKYIRVCQILDNFHWIDWGTSIRGAWIDDYSLPRVECKDILEEYEWWTYDSPGESTRHVIGKVPFTKDNLRALIEFLEDDA
jgi:hypothetical protein